MIKMDFTKGELELEGHAAVILGELTEAMLNLRHGLVKIGDAALADEMMEELIRTYRMDKANHTCHHKSKINITDDTEHWNAAIIKILDAMGRLM